MAGMDRVSPPHPDLVAGTATTTQVSIKHPDEGPSRSFPRGWRDLIFLALVFCVCVCFFWGGRCRPFSDILDFPLESHEPGQPQCRSVYYIGLDFDNSVTTYDVSPAVQDFYLKVRVYIYL